jgi:hypothetical protein
MFRFTIRELVLLTLVVALGVGWWLEHRTLTNANANPPLLSYSTEGRGGLPDVAPSPQKASPDEN